MIVKVLNLDSLIKKIAKASEVNIMPEIIRSARKVQATAKDLAPVDTGILKGSIRTKSYPKQQSAIVFTTTEYGPYQEFGTSKMKPHPFMQPAFDANKKEIESNIKTYIKKHLKDSTR